MDEKTIEEQRKKIISKLVEIIKASDKINAEIQNLPHSGRCIVHRSSESKGEMYIIHLLNDGFVAKCNIDDKIYEIEIYQK